MTTRREAKIPCRSNSDGSRSKGKTENVESIENKPINTHGQLIYDVLSIIFKNLNAKDLRNAAKVCKSWSEAANNEKRKREAAPFTLLGNLLNSWKDLFPEREPIDLLRIKPMLSLMFTRPFDSKHPADKKDNVDCPCRILPSNCPHLTVGNHGIVKDALETDDPQKAVFMFLPDGEKMHIRTIFCPLTDTGGTRVRRSHAFNSDPVRSPELVELRTYGDKAKCYVILTSDEFQFCSSVISCITRDRCGILSGGVASNLSLCQNKKFCSKPLAWIALIISGRGVRSWSAVLERTEDTKRKIEDKMKRFRRQVELKKHSMAFMFACEGRGEYMFREPNVESTIFKKFFPEIPLVGCSGVGEYGDNVLGNPEMVVLYKQRAVAIVDKKKAVNCNDNLH